MSGQESCSIRPGSNAPVKIVACTASGSQEEKRKEDKDTLLKACQERMSLRC